MDKQDAQEKHKRSEKLSCIKIKLLTTKHTKHEKEKKKTIQKSKLDGQD